MKHLLVAAMSLIVFGTVSLLHAAPTQNYVFLNTYDQLVNYIGKPGTYFVKDAAGSSIAGQHGDPTVQKGWAMYVWELGSGALTGKWRKIAEQESMDNSVNEMLLSKYITKENVNEIVNTIYAEMDAKIASDEAFQQLTENVNTLDRKVETAENKVSVLESDVGRIENKADTTAVDLSTLRSQISDLALSGVTEISNKVDQLIVAVNTLNTQLKVVEDLLTGIDVGERDKVTLYKIYDVLKAIKKPDETPTTP